MNTEQIKDDIIYYGTTFGLTSRHTSFLAIDNDQPTPRPIGLSHDIFTIFAVAPAARGPARGGPAAYSATAFFAAAPQGNAGARNITTAANQENGGLDDRVPYVEADPTVLFELAALQSINGGFNAKVSEVIQLLLPRGGITAQPVLDKYGISDGELVAALLAWAWMALCCGEEADGMKTKADAWLRENAKGVDVDGIQRELSDSVKFESM